MVYVGLIFPGGLYVERKPPQMFKPEYLSVRVGERNQRKVL